MSEKFLELINIRKIYPTRSGPKIVLNGINLRINYGDKIGILGRNAAGKSTLIRIIGGVSKPTSGKILRRMKVSWPLAFQGGFQGSLTGLDNLKFICRIYGVPWKEKYEFVKEFADLGDYFYEPVKTYSSGMRARLAFAISLAVDFDCYLIDEVVAVGDSRFHQKCKRELFENKAEKSYILVSHQGNYIKQFCNRFFVLSNGQLQEFPNFQEAWNFYTSQ
ncbi:ABC transporter ATP-binding protein [Thermosulfurimonas dismutans]|uniref:Capsular polysaccharide ABC transporter, ATP-binding protein KpsT n=1 Tax=Thermosulfurimonas dismutans TaxID=999894 RepID=A0A179D1C6_9BACT|nr:ABC transporter ATP-binding protein [Thermosulfurimonas dismutans]OAQ19857.1 Capsular polysaccharide ABC transporter, ATP-binding protein KpsT [Thermosulfurimonas dismutans]